MTNSSIERYREWARKIEDDPRFAAEELKLAFADELARTLEAKGIRRTELAEKLKTNRGYVTRVLNTEYNLTIETMARIAYALGARVSLHVHPKGTYVDWSEVPVGRARPAHSDGDIRYPSRDRQDVPVVADRPASRPGRKGRGKRRSEMKRRETGGNKAASPISPEQSAIDQKLEVPVGKDPQEP